MRYALAFVGYLAATRSYSALIVLGFVAGGASVFLIEWFYK
jgi:hypothetical protein